MKITLKTTLSTVSRMPSRSGVLASPAERRAALNMKNRIMPKPNTNIVRR